MKLNDNLREDLTRFAAAGAEHHTTNPRISFTLRVYNLAVYLG